MITKLLTFVKKLISSIRLRMTETETDKSQHQYSNKGKSFYLGGASLARPISEQAHLKDSDKKFEYKITY